ncbi:NAD P-binding protein [Gloeophyllum trabeum ATCC 11539]|uniref:NAD P-binding protein n=1 Tax=Gloeophyllum trabeum (strain ATCC 11539 / FP-39264 / Madison 617) TaxID=670483 RepID=S7Q2J1_GLOTA|nr:NAD P-binding protein [Gloeophyllum trabeum ATCC 11539]EPQ53753.1 NAD P-binding protein [Gloeophyllum trabeum ATCC 11539]
MSTSITSNSSFDFDATAEAVAAALSSHIDGRTILTTGVTPAGLGAGFASVVAAHNPRLLVLAGRNPSKLTECVKDIEIAHPGVKTRTLELDLASQASVRKAAEEVLSWPEPVDILVNNAAIMACPYQKTADGLEMQFGTNHLGPRVVNVSSAAHRFSDIRWDDIGFKDGQVYDKWRAYGQAKTANILFSVALAEKLGSKGLKVFVLHPGPVQTNLDRYISPHDYADLLALDKELGNKEVDLPKFRYKNVSQGTATYVVAAFDPALNQHNGIYLQDCQLAPEEETKPYAVDKGAAERLRKLSEELVGQKFVY